MCEIVKKAGDLASFYGLHFSINGGYSVFMSFTTKYVAQYHKITRNFSKFSTKKML